MKAILEYNLPEDQAEFDLASKAGRLSLALYEIGQFLRTKEKYCELTEEQSKLVEEIRAKFYEETADLLE